MTRSASRWIDREIAHNRGVSRLRTGWRVYITAADILFDAMVEDQFTCDCGESFDSKAELKRHARDAHDKD